MVLLLVIHWSWLLTKGTMYLCLDLRLYHDSCCAFKFSKNWAATWDFQKCGMCNQQSLRPACAYAQSDQSLCLSLEYSITLRLLAEHHLEFLSLKDGCTGLSESTHVKVPHCWKSHVAAELILSMKRESWLLYFNVLCLGLVCGLWVLHYFFLVILLWVPSFFIFEKRGLKISDIVTIVWLQTNSPTLPVLFETKGCKLQMKQVLNYVPSFLLFSQFGAHILYPRHSDKRR